MGRRGQQRQSVVMWPVRVGNPGTGQRTGAWLPCRPSFATDMYGERALVWEPLGMPLELAEVVGLREEAQIVFVEMERRTLGRELQMRVQSFNNRSISLCVCVWIGLLRPCDPAGALPESSQAPWGR